MPKVMPSPEELDKIGAGEYSHVGMKDMSPIAIGNILPDPKAVEAIREATEKRNKPARKADPEAWRRSKNKVYQRKMARQHGVSSAEFYHEKRKGK